MRRQIQVYPWQHVKNKNEKDKITLCRLSAEQRCMIIYITVRRNFILYENKHLYTSFKTPVLCTELFDLNDLLKKFV